MKKTEVNSQNRINMTMSEDGVAVPLVGYQLTMSNAEKYYDMMLFKRAFQECGLDDRYVGEVTSEGICTRTISETVKQLKNHNYTFKKVGDETSNTVVWKIYKQEVSRSNGKLDAEMLPFAHITFFKSNNTIQSDNAEIEQMLTRNHRIFILNYINADVSRYIRTMLERESTLISLRKSGGVYIIPAKDHDLIDKVSNLFNKIDPNGDFNIIEIPDLAKSRKSMSVGFQRNIEDVCKEIRDKMQKMKEAGDDMSKTIRKNLYEELVELEYELKIMRDITLFGMNDSEELMKEVTQEIAAYSTL